VFKIKLMLPRVHTEARADGAPEAVRTGYAGRRRKVLVVDNERVDRELLVNILAPLGFEMAQAVSGADCVDNYAALGPDLILMDLAMPGMDGWEASRIIRQVHRSEVPIAIVSANAYDKGLENPAAIPAEDFFVKPVNVAELLDWIGRRLQLEWISHAGPKSISSEIAAAETAPPPVLLFPPAAQLVELRAQLKLGYVRGIVHQLDEIATLGPQYSAFIAAMRGHAARFQLDAMARLLEQCSETDQDLGEQHDTEAI
jgi:CheY-like chemotaxis protein